MTAVRAALAEALAGGAGESAGGGGAGGAGGAEQEGRWNGAATPDALLAGIAGAAGEIGAMVLACAGVVNPKP